MKLKQDSSYCWHIHSFCDTYCQQQERNMKAFVDRLPHTLCKTSFIFVCCTLCILMTLMDTAIATYTEEVKLHETLLAGYSKNVRPRNNETQLTKIHVMASLTSVSDLDEVKETFTAVCLFFVYWDDDNLGWNPSNHGNITEITIDRSMIWSPGFIISNSAKKMERLGESASSTHAFWYGVVLWEFGHVIHTTCDINVKYFPFDTQHCVIRLMTIGLFYNHINLTISPLDTSIFAENNAWVLQSTSTEKVHLGLQPYAKYTVILRRRYTFYILNLFSPVLILAFLNTMVFVLPAESGERIGYAITCLLSLSVYMTFASESLPNSSKPLPIITLILLAYIIISTLISIGTVVGLRFHLHDNSQPPSAFLIKLFCLWNKTKCKRSKVTEIVESETDSVKCSFANEFSWKDVAKAFDKLCFVISNIFIFLLTFLYFVIVPTGI